MEISRTYIFTIMDFFFMSNKALDAATVINVKSWRDSFYISQKFWVHSSFEVSNSVSTQPTLTLNVTFFLFGLFLLLKLEGSFKWCFWITYRGQIMETRKWQFENEIESSVYYLCKNSTLLTWHENKYPRRKIEMCRVDMNNDCSMQDSMLAGKQGYCHWS